MVKAVPPPPLPLCLSSILLAVAAFTTSSYKEALPPTETVALVRLQQTVDADHMVLSLCYFRPMGVNSFTLLLVARYLRSNVGASTPSIPL